MRVILLKDISKIGQRNDVKEVADGFAMNYLIPRRLAEVATAKKIGVLAKRRAEVSEKEAAQTKILHESVKKISGKTISLSAKANEQGHLFKGLRERDIALAIEKESGVRLPLSALVLPEPLKEIGEHTLTVSAGGGETSVTILVKAEK